MLVGSMTEVILVAVDVQVDRATGKIKQFQDTVQRESKETEVALKRAGDQAERSAKQTAGAQKTTGAAASNMATKFRGAGAAVSAATGAVQVMGVQGGPLTTLGSSLAALAVSGTGPLALVVAGVTALSLVLANMAKSDGPADQAIGQIDELRRATSDLARELRALESDRSVLEQTLIERIASGRERVQGLQSGPSGVETLERRLNDPFADPLRGPTRSSQESVIRVRKEELALEKESLRQLEMRLGLLRKVQVMRARDKTSRTGAGAVSSGSILDEFAAAASLRGSARPGGPAGPMTPEQRALGRGIGNRALAGFLGDSQVGVGQQLAFENRGDGRDARSEILGGFGGRSLQGQIDRARDEEAREAEARARAERDRLALSEEFRAPGRGFAQSVVSELSMAFSSGEFDNVLTTLQTRLTETFADAALAGLAKGLGLEAAAENVSEGIGNFFSGASGGPTSTPVGGRK